MFYPKIFQIIKFTTLVLCQVDKNEREENLVHNIYDNIVQQDEDIPLTFFEFSDSEFEDDGAEYDIVQSQDNSVPETNNDNLDSTHNTSFFHRSSAVHEGLSELTGLNPTTSRNSSSNDENVATLADQTSSDNKYNDEVDGNCRD